MLLAGDLIAHWLADDLNAATGDGDAVSGWIDSIGNVAAEATGSPTLIKNVLSGHSLIRFNPSDGDDFFQVIGRDSPLRQADDFSVTVAFSTDSTDLVGGMDDWYENTGLVDANLSNLGRGWGLSINQAAQVSGGIGAGFFEPVTSVYSTPSGLNDGKLHFATLTRSGDTLSLYVDDGGPSTATGADTMARDRVNVMFGVLQNRNNPFNGGMAEVRFYDGSLTITEVGALHQQLDSFYDNQAPIAVDDTYNISEDPPFGFVSIDARAGILANDSDSENDDLSVEIVDPPQSITVNLVSDGSMSFVLPQDFSGTDSFTYIARDVQASNVATVTIHVASVYDPATAVDDSYKLQPTETLKLSATTGILSNDLNPDQVPLTSLLVSDVSQGSLKLAADGSLQFDPQGQAGVVSFTYQIDDQTQRSAPATVTFIVNTPPVAHVDTLTVNEDTELVLSATEGVLINDNDADGNALSATLVDGPQHGELTFRPDGSLSLSA